MRLLIYGSKQNQNTIGAFFIRNFDAAVEYDILSFPDEFTDLLRSRFCRFVFKFAPRIIVRKMDHLLLKQVDQFKPAIVLIFKGMEISSSSLKQIRKQGIKLVNYNFDHPYSFFSRGTGNDFVREAIPYYDLHISYSSIIADELARKFNVKTSRIPFGFHLTEEQFRQVVNENREEILRTCFVGNPDHLRVVQLNQLVTERIPISLYGFGWEKYFQPSDLVEIHPPRKSGSFWADPIEFWKVLRQYRVQLNFFRPHNEGSHNLRTFEVPAVGGVLLTPKSREQDEFFEDGVEIFTYADFQSLASQCRSLLEKDAAWVRGVRIRARQKSLEKDYSYGRRTRDLLCLLHGLVKTRPS